MTTDDLDKHLKKINSLTKYPSIKTYHARGPKGVLLEKRNVEFNVLGEGVVATEKIDGCNSRIILLPRCRYLIGSREELLTADSDLIYNPMLGIVNTLRSVAKRLCIDLAVRPSSIITVYLEVYGGNICKASKQYTNDQSYSCRLFDVSIVQLNSQTFERSLEQIASWRKHDGQTFFSEAQLQTLAVTADIKLTPRIEIDGVPRCITMTRAWLELLSPVTQAGLGGVEAGTSEGIVLRTHDRTAIAKLRFKDYERHARAEA